MEEREKGIFSAVSAGPGDPELMTLGSVKILEKADVVAAPRTASGQMLALEIVRGVCPLEEKIVLPMDFVMSRDPEVVRAQHERIAAETAAYLDRGLNVAMVNLGDVAVYSTAFYIMEVLRKWGYTCRMHAGVPSFCAVASRLGISMTERNLPVHIIPGAYPVGGLLEQEGTIVLMKSGRQIRKVLEELKRRDLLSRSSMVVNCGMPEEQVISDLSRLDPSEEIGYFATIIVRPRRPDRP
ncbi:precorrin-2 C(20)-methyltransferase [Eubacterium pyruvativorans]|uniref:precorrin-2 C(20)-methyltransferase n=1 Tax=Eubacterium pyruvativorans TaxID=155865 RepID=UPI001568F5F3|nr:precorrin-2 C(20)-methyltransferase [Eubacterium pyruvativorans]